MSLGKEKIIMKFKQFYLGCLSHASYYISSEGQAAIIDPQRDVDQYIDEADANGDKIKYIIETHSHADFVSGHIELAERTGAEIIFGQRANTEFATHKVSDGDTLMLGKVELKFLETPGHTPEGITILASESNSDAPIKVFTGDTLFIGDVGRPDLVGSKGFTAEQMGAMLYDSLYEKILPLADDSEIYPAHGAGSLCGKSLSKDTWSTLGEQRKFNYALQPMSKDEFIKIVAADQPEVPAYFPLSASQNLKGSAPLNELSPAEHLSADEVENFKGVVIDIRSAADFGAGHIPNAINIGLGGQFASWAGTLVTIGTPVAIAADTKAEVDEAFMRLARVGIESVGGYVLMSEYTGKKNGIEQITVQEMSEIANGEKPFQFVDVRRVGEYNAGHAVMTRNISLDRLSRDIDQLDPSIPTYVICQGGYRSSAGTSILENARFEKIYNVTGGTAAWIDSNLETEASVAACSK